MYHIYSIWIKVCTGSIALGMEMLCLQRKGLDFLLILWFFFYRRAPMCNPPSLPKASFTGEISILYSYERNWHRHHFEMNFMSFQKLSHSLHHSVPCERFFLFVCFFSYLVREYKSKYMLKPTDKELILFNPEPCWLKLWDRFVRKSAVLVFHPWRETNYYFKAHVANSFYRWAQETGVNEFSDLSVGLKLIYLRKAILIHRLIQKSA